MRIDSDPPDNLIKYIADLFFEPIRGRVLGIHEVLADLGYDAFLEPRVLADRVRARRHICDLYRKKLEDAAGISFMPDAGYGTSTRWLTVILVDPMIATGGTAAYTAGLLKKRGLAV